MILQSLNQYYERLRDDPDADIPLFGFGKQEDPFCPGAQSGRETDPDSGPPREDEE